MGEPSCQLLVSIVQCDAHSVPFYFCVMHISMRAHVGSRLSRQVFGGGETRLVGNRHELLYRTQHFEQIASATSASAS